MKDVEIGRFGETKDKACEDNSHLYYKLDLAVEALNKILKRAKEVNKDGFSEYTRRVCQNVLREIEE